ncbi:hypothetical protein F4809DRAFT_649319 [Biscogniauxia mediterranea]|nr:hypothetical protein F4809DRAFT_649319 [Biscogniauxia mediterranea]
MADPLPTYYPVTFDQVVLDSCIMCENKATVECPRCGTKYCGAECQKQDWPCHKQPCRTFPQFAEDERPVDPGYYRVILFPTEELKPTFAWMKFYADGRGPTEQWVNNLLRSDDISMCELYDLDKVPALRIGCGLRALVPGDGINRRPGLRLNRSVLGLAQPGHIRAMYGAVLFCAYTREKTETDDWGGVVPHDATFRDLRAAIDFLLFQYIDCIGNIGRFHVLYGQNHIVWPGVKLNCEGDSKRYLELGYSPGMVETVIASKLGLSWLWQKMSSQDDLVVEVIHIPNTLQNYQVRHLVLNPEDPKYRSLVDIDPPASTFTLPLGLLNYEFGSVIVVHERGLPIHPLHVATFIEFMAKAMDTVPSRVETEWNHRRIRLLDAENLDAIVTKENFQDFWEKQQRTIPSDHPLRQLPSPYLFEDD